MAAGFLDFASCFKSGHTFLCASLEMTKGDGDVRSARNHKAERGCALRSKSQGGTGACAALEITKWEGRRMNGKEVRRQSELTKGGGKGMKTKGFNARMNRQKVAATRMDSKGISKRA